MTIWKNAGKLRVIERNLDRRWLEASSRVIGPKERWVDGTPEYSFHICGLRKLFPEARFVHVFRDVGAVVRSMVNFHRVAGVQLVEKNEEHAYRYWIRTVTACLLAERAYGPHIVHRIRYVDLMDNPESTMRALLNFVNEPYAERCLEPLAERINPGQCYLLELFSRSGKSRAARVSLQIVWQDALHHPLDPTTTSVRVIDTDEPWELAHAEFLSPPESRYAIIYAKTDTGAAWLDDYSFRQLASNCDPILKAVPNPAVQMPGTNQSRRTSLSWDSHAGASLCSGVSVNHQPEMHFVEGPEGMRFFDIEAKAVWEFRLYAGKGNNPIKTATVTSEEISPLSASPVVFTSSSLLGTTTISWNMPAHPEAEVGYHRMAALRICLSVALAAPNRSPGSLAAAPMSSGCTLNCRSEN